MRRTFEQSGVHFGAAYLEVYKRINHELWFDFEQGKIASELLRTRRFELLFEAIGVLIDASVFGPRYLANLAAGSELTEGALDLTPCSV